RGGHSGTAATLCRSAVESRHKLPALVGGIGGYLSRRSTGRTCGWRWRRVDGGAEAVEQGQLPRRMTTSAQQRDADREGQRKCRLVGETEVDRPIGDAGRPRDVPDLARRHPFSSKTASAPFKIWLRRAVGSRSWCVRCGDAISASSWDEC